MTDRLSKPVITRVFSIGDYYSKFIRVHDTIILHRANIYSTESLQYRTTLLWFSVVDCSNQLKILGCPSLTPSNKK
jgi:hypothetical protein